MTLRLSFAQGARRSTRLRGLILFASLSIFSASGCRHSHNTISPTPPPAVSPTRFVDIAGAAGLKYRWIPPHRPNTILTALGFGCAFLDYNNDGNLDILLVGPKLALYRGDGHGHFTDVTQKMGLSNFSGKFIGCAVGDYDNDGFDDIYVSAYRGGMLLHNEGGEHFRDVTQKAGIKPQPWGTSCGFADLDNDGYLDLYVANYIDFDSKTRPQFCGPPDALRTCPPESYKGIKGTLYHNLGGKSFVDVTKAWGASAHSGKGLGEAFADFDGSGHVSLALANDTVPGNLLKNTGMGMLKNVAESAGIGYQKTGMPYGGMGIDWGDYDNDGKLDLFVATFQDQYKEVYHNIGNGLFEDVSKESGIGEPTATYVAFGCKFFDYDNDGWLDLIIANGDVAGEHPHLPGWTYQQPTQLFHNPGRLPVVYEDVSNVSGPDLQRHIIGRGLAVGDFDNDGRVDVLIVDSSGSPLLLHNESSPAGRWLSVRLTGTRGNRDGLGAVLTATIGDRKLTRQCETDGSYYSASDRRVHFGVGAARKVDSLSIRWPSGHIQVLRNIAVDQILNVRED